MTDPTDALTGYCAAARDHPVHGPYHEHEYGSPVRDDDRLFERLVLEINQAGLSWLTILKKRDAGLDDWVRLFRDEFRFTGGQICREFLLSTGYLPGAHDPACPVHDRIVALSPPWLEAS